MNGPTRDGMSDSHLIGGVNPAKVGHSLTTGNDPLAYVVTGGFPTQVGMRDACE